MLFRSTSGGGKTITTTNLTANVTTAIYAYAVDTYSNASCTSLVSFTHDNVAPTIVSFVRTSPAVTNSVPVTFTATFSKAIDTNSFTPTDVSNAGTAGSVTWTVTSVSSTQFTVQATASGDGTLMPRIAASGISDLAGNVNSAAITATQSADYTASSLTVTINQASGQADPVNVATSLNPIRFTIVFSRAINQATFDTTDIVRNGTANGIT